jgi:asparagine synthase (glutamine-hydrolysing)
MSGIFGVCYFDGQSVKPEILQQMSDILAHRGSDGVDIWYRNNVGLGHRLLWTTPESLLEEQPLIDKRHNLVLTADARIDNRDELIESLELNHLPKEKITDSDLILAAYQKWGEECPDKLFGDFAFAIWDRRKQQLFGARDPMGIKPFYYYHSAQVFAFASEIKALWCLTEIPKKINELKIAYQLAMFCEDQEATYYQNIFRLPSAHSLVVKPTRQVKKQRYWSLDLNHRIKLKSHQEYIEAFREIFFESVRCRLRSAFPVGSTLSGGLDSSSIACTANQLLQKSTGQQLHTFSAIFPSLPAADLRQIDERHYMQQVQSLEGIQAHNVRADLLNPLLNYLWQEEEPVLSFNLYIHDGLYQCANQNGVRVFLDGVDGDTTISHGWGYLTTLAYQFRWRRLWQEINAVRKNAHLSRKLVFQEYCIKPLINEPWKYLKQRFIPIEHDLVNPTLAKKVNLDEQIRNLSDERLFITARQQHLNSISTGLYPFAMEITDKGTSKWSLEARYPFFDRRLMEFCLAIPLEQKFRQGYPRAILRHGMSGILPTEIQWRFGKSLLGSNFSHRLLEKEKTTFKNVLERHQLLESYVNMPSLQESYGRFVNGNQPRPGDDLNVFNATLLSLWLSKL